ncbi:hypothetical protein HPB47_016992 [Ixodes persulcatus]|uniref:Uncharacterized protein n=1 Tax=Ixodes persulcatus TaxID=34615 RepID=A0AC60QS24_IXOPE|nr:hypothetical protein HPB47_016992 [Ixodes persulcatus]
MEGLRATPPRTARRYDYVSTYLNTCTQVFVRHDAVRTPLQHPYDGPYKLQFLRLVLHRLLYPLRTRCAPRLEKAGKNRTLWTASLQRQHRLPRNTLPRAVEDTGTHRGYRTPARVARMRARRPDLGDGRLNNSSRPHGKRGEKRRGQTR